MLIDILQQIYEGRAEIGLGSKAGREKYTTPKEKKSSPVKARKSRVRIFDTIQDALKSSAPFGSIFSTKGADRLYVISRKKWGKDKQSQVGVRIAKGFTPGSATPSASWPSIKAHSVRTMLKHGGSKSKRLTAKYGAGKKRPEEKRYAGKNVKESIEALHEALPLIPAALGAIRAVGTKLAGRGATVAKGAVKSGTKKSLAKKVTADGPRVAGRAAANMPSPGGPTQQVTHTEYDGPSLSEFLDDLAVAATYDLGKKAISHLLKKRQRRKEQVKPKSQNASTEHEGPSLREKISYLQLFRETVDLTPDEGGALKRGAGGRAGKSRANRRDRAKARQLMKKEAHAAKFAAGQKAQREKNKASLLAYKARKAARRKAKAAAPGTAGGGPSAEEIGIAVAKHGPYGKGKGDKKPPKKWRTAGRIGATGGGWAHSALTAAGKAAGLGKTTQKVY